MSQEKSVVFNITGDNATVIVHTSAPSFGCVEEIETEKEKSGQVGIMPISSTGSPGRG
jgi:hypothetical protein